MCVCVYVDGVQRVFMHVLCIPGGALGRGPLFAAGTFATGTNFNHYSLIFGNSSRILG